ncbi:MAG: flavodoxin family protein [Deltaproteobacteria bacterium]|nr:flavodoxin family protein [Deltaproteobacteria bacterium]
MKVLAILGSPHKNGATAGIARKFSETAATCGADIQTVVLNELQYKGCQGCYACKTTSEECVLRDDLTPVLKAMHAADIILFASPIFFHHVTGQFKLFLDRTYSLLTPEFITGPKRSRLPEGKQAVFVMTQGAPAEMFAGLFPDFLSMKEFFGFSEMHLIRGGEFQRDQDASSRPELLAQAEELARKLVSVGR